MIDGLVACYTVNPKASQGLIWLFAGRYWCRCSQALLEFPRCELRPFLLLSVCLVLILIVACLFACSFINSELPWYDLHGLLGVKFKSQLSIYLSIIKLFVLCLTSFAFVQVKWSSVFVQQKPLFPLPETRLTCTYTKCCILVGIDGNVLSDRCVFDCTYNKLPTALGNQVASPTCFRD